MTGWAWKPLTAAGAPSLADRRFAGINARLRVYRYRPDGTPASARPRARAAEPRLSAIVGEIGLRGPPQSGGLSSSRPCSL